MPKCGSQITICDVPIRFDTYKGCSHNCKYCFTYRKYNINNIEIDEGYESLKNFIDGKRNLQTNWCDWDIPIHWGGMSDPFQPVEKIKKNSLKCLELFASTKYPFIVSTKNTLPSEEPYYSLFKECNCVFQCSAVCPTLSKIELGAPHFEERLKMLEKMSKICKRVVVRCQPYMIQYHNEIKEQIKRFAEAGVYGIIYEAIKMQTKVNGMVKVGADFCYPKKQLELKFKELKAECHKYGLKFFAGENRLRPMGDSLCCCGCEGLEGFKVNKYNLNHYIYDKENCQPTEKMKNLVGGGMVFKALKQENVVVNVLERSSFKDIMDTVFKDKKIIEDYLGESEK